MRCLSLSWVVVVTFANFTSAEEVSVEGVRQANVDNIAALGTGTVVYMSEHSNSPVAAQGFKSKIAADYKDKPEQRAHNLSVVNANVTHRRERNIVTFDAKSATWKISAQDLRDLDAIMEREHLPVVRRGQLDLSRVTLVSRGLSAQFSSVSNRVCFDRIGNASQHSILSSPLRFGVVSDKLFDDYPEHEIRSCSMNGRSLICVALKGPSGSCVLKCDEEVGLRVRSIEYFSPAGRLMHSSLADDYRVVNGIPFPFRGEQVKYDDSGSVLKRETIIVESAIFNDGDAVSVSELNLVIPQGSRAFFLNNAGGTAVITEDSILRPSTLQDFVLTHDPSPRPVNP